MRSSSYEMQAEGFRGLRLEGVPRSGIPAAYIVAALATVLFLCILTSAALAVGPFFVSAQIDAEMPAGGLDKIVAEEYDGTLVLKGMVWEGSAVWYDNAESDDDGDDEWDIEDEEPLRSALCWEEDPESVIGRGKVTVKGILLTEGTADDFLGNPGILWLQYAFTDDEGLTIGAGEGFVTLESIDDCGGAASFDGTVKIDGNSLVFSGTGWSDLSEFIHFREYQDWLADLEEWKANALAGLEAEYQEEKALLVEEYADDPAGLDEALAELDAWLEESKAGILGDYQEYLEEITDEIEDDSLTQWFGSTVLTAQKPGFDFEAARKESQLTTLYSKASRKLDRARTQRLRVMRKIRSK